MLAWATLDLPSPSPLRGLIDRYFRAVAKEDARPGVHYQLGRQDALRRWREARLLSAETEQMVMIWLVNTVLPAPEPSAGGRWRTGGCSGTGLRRGDRAGGWAQARTS